MTIHFCQKYKSVFLTKGKSFFSCLAANPIFRWRLDNPLRYDSDIVGLIEVPYGIRDGFRQHPPACRFSSRCSEIGHIGNP